MKNANTERGINMSGGSGSYSPSPKAGSSRSVKFGKEGEEPNDQQGEEKDNDCLIIDEETRLQSPVPEVISTLKPGDILTLKTTAGRAPVVAVNALGKTAGSIVPSSLSSLIRCIENGFSYVANVISIRGGICIVHIVPKL